MLSIIVPLGYGIDRFSSYLWMFFRFLFIHSKCSLPRSHKTIQNNFKCFCVLTLLLWPLRCKYLCGQSRKYQENKTHNIWTFYQWNEPKGKKSIYPFILYVIFDECIRTLGFPQFIDVAFFLKKINKQTHTIDSDGVKQ